MVGLPASEILNSCKIDGTYEIFSSSLNIDFAGNLVHEGLDLTPFKEEQLWLDVIQFSSWEKTTNINKSYHKILIYSHLSQYWHNLCLNLDSNDENLLRDIIDQIKMKEYACGIVSFLGFYFGNGITKPRGYAL